MKPVLELDGVLIALPGTHIVRIRRLLYVIKQVPVTSGAIEITFDKDCYLFDVGGDGETLQISRGPWVDPFDLPLSEENAAYVAEAGKWDISRVDSIAPYSGLIGSLVLSAASIKTPETVISGSVVESDCGVIRIEVQADELIVEVVGLEHSQ